MTNRELYLFSHANTSDSNQLDELLHRTIKSIDGKDATFVPNSLCSNCGELTTVNFPEATEILSSAFNNCDKLTSIDFPKVQTIRDSAFSGCNVLNNVFFPEVTSIDNGVFNACFELANVSLPKVETIGQRVFYQCPKLTYIDLPKAASIGQYAFAGVSSGLTIILRNATMTKLSSSSAFMDRSRELLKIYVPDNLIGTYKSNKVSGQTNQWYYLASYIFPISQLPTENEGM